MSMEGEGGERFGRHSHHGPLGPGQVLGTSVMGERGQVVIPAEARKELDLQSGDRFIVFGSKHKGMVCLIKSDVFNSFADFFFTQSAMFEKIGQSIREQTDEMLDNAADTDAVAEPDSATTGSDFSDA